MALSPPLPYHLPLSNPPPHLLTLHNPRKAKTVDKIVSDYSTPEILASLRRKYGHAAVASLYETEDETTLLPVSGLQV
jgi:hypothetical protein